MAFILLGLLLLQGSPGRAQIDHLIRNLGHDSIEIREEADRKLYDLRDATRSHLERALKDPNPEIRGRASSLLFRLRWDPDINLLMSEYDARRERAYKALLAAGPSVASGLRGVGSAGDPARAFRAGQIARIVESKPVGGLLFGIVVDRPTAATKGAIPGYEVFINVGKTDLVLEVSPDARVTVPGSRHYRGTMSRGGIACRKRPRPRPSLPSRLVTLKPREVFLKRRYDLLMVKNRFGGSGGPVLQERGKWTLVPLYSQKSESGMWSGAITGNAVGVTLEAPSK